MRLNHRESRAVIIIIFLFLVITVITLRLPHIKMRGFLSDEATYLAIAQSLTDDKDIVYEQKDLIRIVEKYPSGPQGIFLKKGEHDNRLTYAKSIIYPLVAAPFYAILRERGMLLFNILIAFFALYSGLLWLRRLTGSDAIALIWVLVFFCCSVAMTYLVWMTPEIFNFSFILLGLIFWSYKYLENIYDEGIHNSFLHKLLMSKYSSVLASIFFALVTCSKPPDVILIIPLGIMLLKDRKWKELGLSILAFALIMILFFGSYYALTGDWNFMGGQRKTFYQTLPFDTPAATFENLGVSHTAATYWKDYEITPSIFIHDFFYFFLGRFSGIFLYYCPTLFILILFFVNKKNLISVISFIAIAVLSLESIILIPHNYFGGGGTLGNRYFMNIYPLFFILIPRIASIRSAIMNIIYSAVFIGQININIFYSSFFPFTHAKYFPFKLFYPEMTMVENLPTNVNMHAFHIPFGNPPQYYLYYLDDNFYIPEKGGFWVPGEKETEFILETGKQPKEIIFNLENGLANNNRVEIKIDSGKQKLDMISGEKNLLNFNGTKGYFHAYQKWFYRIRVKSEKGYIPAFWQTDLRDRRFLGCFVRIELR